MATLTPQFYELLEADTKEIYFTRLDQIPELFSQLFLKRSSSKAYEDRMRIVGFGTLALKEEGTPIAFDDPTEGGRSRVTHSTYALGWRASMEMMQDDQHGIMARMSGDLAESTRDHRERLAWGMIDDGYGTTLTGLDGDNLFESTHVSIGPNGISQSNILSPAVALGVTGLEAIKTLSQTTRSEEGRYITLKQELLVIHPDLAHQAYQLLNTEFEVGTSNNDRSTVVSSRSGLKPIEVPYLSSSTRWSVHAKPGSNSIFWNDRMPVDFTSAGDAVTKDLQNFAMYRASVQFDDWKQSFASNF